MRTGLPLLSGVTLAEGSDAVLDYLGAAHPDVLWALIGPVQGGHEVLDVRDPDGLIRAGDVLEVAMQGGDALVQPLLGQAGEELGALWALDRASSGALAPMAPLIVLLAELLSMLLRADRARAASARRSEVLHEQAHSDELTELPNRRGWAQVLEAEQPADDAEPDAPSVIVIDLDGLKEVNDDYGHVAGDEYLQLAAMTLSAACRDSDFVARLGGDEFGVLVGGSGPEPAERLVTRIREALDAAGVAASIGCAHYESDGGLVRTWWRADHAMYAEKQRRRHEMLDVRQPAKEAAAQGVQR